MNTLQIGNVTIEKTAALAPMASVTDHAYRVGCKRFGAAYLVGEMISAKGITFGDKKSAALLTVTPEETPMAVQLFGTEPLVIAKAAEAAAKFSPQIIDLNMGCPVPKVAGNGSGAALMRTPQLAEELVRAAVDAVDIPVTVKIRKGWDAQSVNAVEFAKRMENAGAAAITVHGRTRAQMYAPKADWDIIRQVKEAVQIPVIGNGDVDSPQSAAAMYEQTGCDLVMIGRGSYGRPWLFSQVAAYLKDGTLLPDPPAEERMACMLRHIRILCDDKGEAVGMREARRHAVWYFKGERGAAALRNRCASLTAYAELQRLAEEFLRQQESPAEPDMPS